MKFSLIFKGLLLTTLIAITATTAKLFNDNQVKQSKRADFCRKQTIITQVKVKKYDENGVKERQGTFYKQVAFKTKPVISVVIFPEGLDSKKWSKVPQSSIRYIGKGGHGDIKEWFSPDYFYLLKVPDNTQGLAFGRLCYKNGDATVYSIKDWKQTASNKISINNKIDLEHSIPLAKINPAHILVNAGSHQQDSLGDETEIYFTKERMRIP